MLAECIHGNHNGGCALFDVDKRCIHGANFDMTADDAVTRCAVEVLRRARREISSLPKLAFNSEREAVLWLALNNVKELLMVGDGRLTKFLSGKVSVHERCFVVGDVSLSALFQTRMSTLSSLVFAGSAAGAYLCGGRSTAAGRSAKYIQL